LSDPGAKKKERRDEVDSTSMNRRREEKEKEPTCLIPLSYDETVRKGKKGGRGKERTDGTSPKTKKGEGRGEKSRSVKKGKGGKEEKNQLLLCLSRQKGGKSTGIRKEKKKRTNAPSPWHPGRKKERDWRGRTPGGTEKYWELSLSFSPREKKGNCRMTLEARGTFSP